MQFSLKEFLAIAGVASVGTASLLYASPWVVSLWIAVVGVLIARAAVRVFVLGDARRASSIGFIVLAVLYAGAVLWKTNQELDPRSGSLPTTKAATWPYEWIEKSQAYYVDTEGVRYATAPPDAQVYDPSGAMGPARSAALSSSPFGKIVRRMSVDVNDFMTIAHCLWTLLFGYVGGKYAVWVARRRDAVEEQALAGASGSAVQAEPTD